MEYIFNNKRNDKKSDRSSRHTIRRVLFSGKIALYLCVIILTSSCSNMGKNDLSILSLLINNRIMVLLKGTYASDDPLSFAEINNNQLFIDSDLNINSSNLPAYSNLPIYLDIGELRLSTKEFLSDLSTISNQSDSEKFWDVLSTERQVYCSNLYTIDPRFDSCLDTGGLINYQEFMNGNGAVYPSRDVGPGTYLHAGVFMRGLVTGYSVTDSGPVIAQFDNNEVPGENILPLVNYNPGTTTFEKELYVPQFFPLHHKVEFGQQTSMIIDDGAEPLVVEIRFNLKENLMAHRFLNSANEYQTVVTFSDWRKDHLDVTQRDQGGNVLTRSRVYNPALVSDLVISGGTGSNRYYYAIYIANECVDFNQATYCNKNTEVLPLAATPVRDGENRIKNLMPNSYVLQCLYDNVQDGYPEQLLGEIPVEVTPGAGIVNVACACGASTTTGCN